MDGEQGLKISEVIQTTTWTLVGKLKCPGQGWDTWRKEYLVARHDTAAPIYYELLPQKVVKRVSEETIARSILCYWAGCSALDYLSLNLNHAITVVELFTAYATNFDEKVSPVLFASEPGYAWRRLPFDPKPGQTPTFDEMMARTSNAKALKAWVGSIFDPDSERQQYLWIYGEGMNGKSSLANFLHELLEGSSTSQQPPERYDRFWTSKCLGKRLVVFPDCNNYTFINSGLFKSLTGDDEVHVEEKGKNAYSTRLSCKFLVLSNQKPHIENEASAIRRAIYCHMGPITGKRLAASTYLALLRSEAPAFIQQCIEAYRELAPDRGHIETDQDIIAEIVANAEERWEYIATRHFHFSDWEALIDKHVNEWPHVTRMYMQWVKRYEKLGDYDYRNFLNYLERRHRVSLRAVKLDKGVTRVYIGCSRKAPEGVNDGSDEYGFE